MKVENNRIPFTAIYKMPHADMQVAKEFEQMIAPVYRNFKRDFSHMFLGSNPYEIALVKSLKYYSEDLGYSYSWLRENMKSFGISIPDFSDTDMWVFTGKKDLLRFDSFFKKQHSRVKWMDNLRYFITSFYRNHFTDASNLPAHIRENLGLVHENIRTRKIFEEIMKDIKPIQVKDNADLISKMMKE